MDINKFKKIFAGLDRAYGQYKAGAITEGKKVDGVAITKRGALSDALWQNHLEGKTPSLGSIPIRDDNNCTWGCIDIDTYPLDIKKIISEIRKNKLPLVPCRSKSGGAHLFLFTSDLVPARLAVNKLKEMAASLGHGNCEIFPKQVEVNSSRGDVGSWLNLPYFNANNTMRYAYLDDGSAADLQQFYDLYDKYKVTKEELENLKIKVSKKYEGFDGPPCIEKLMEVGIIQGMDPDTPNAGRDNGLFHYAVYAKKKWPEEWQNKVNEFNNKYMKPPLSYREVEKTIRSHEGKEYKGYLCKVKPACSYCSEDVCMTRKFGIEKGDLDYDFTDVKKFQTEDSYWYITIDKKQVRVRTSVLFDYNKFALAVFDQINVLIGESLRKNWRKKLKEIGDSAQIEKLADDTTLDGRFDEHLHSFVNDLGKAQTVDEVAYGKCYHEDGYIYFKMKFLTQYLDKQRFRGYDSTRTAARLRELGAEQAVRKADKKNSRMWKIGAEAFERIAKLPVPDMESEKEDLPF